VSPKRVACGICRFGAALLLACGGAESAEEERTLPVTTRPDVERRVIDAPESHHEREGFVEMAPPVRLPTTHDRRDLIRIWARFPESPAIRTRYVEEQGRYTIRAPSGSKTDRVEYVLLDGAPIGERVSPPRTIIDIRGLEVGRDGPARFRVLRPVDGSVDADLAGYDWAAFDEAARRAASNHLRRFVSSAGRPIDRPPLSGEGLDHFLRMNHCGRCHVPTKQLDLTADSSGMPRRATDQNGCYTLLMMLADGVPLSSARPVDLNRADPHVRFRCGDAVLTADELASPPRCPGGDEVLPVAFRDIRSGLDAGDRYTEKVCAGRRYIHRHLDDCGRQVFHDAFAECGIASEPPAAGCPTGRDPT